MKQKLIAWFKAHKKLVLIVGGIILAILIGFLIYSFLKSDDNVARFGTEVETSEEESAIKYVNSPLTGVEVEASLAERPVTAIVIENSPDARPQSGLDDAGIVFEAIAEGGITRFLAFYQESRPDPIGPVRSLRPYFIDWILAFDAGVAHVGGSQQALREIKEVGGRDLDQFAYGDSYYRTTDRFAPHNVYTDFDLLDALNKELGYKSSDFESLPRKDDAPLEVPTAGSIAIDISSYLYEPSYTYDPDTNSYLRKMADQKHIDRESKKQLSPKVVVVLEVPNSIVENGRYDYDLVGSGVAYVFQDGDVIKGKWKKSTRSSQIQLLDSNQQDIELNRGQTWFSAVSPGRDVTYSP